MDTVTKASAIHSHYDTWPAIKHLLVGTRRPFALCGARDLCTLLMLPMLQYMMTLTIFPPSYTYLLYTHISHTQTYCTHTYTHKRRDIYADERAT